ncbi:Protein CBG17900 [Caenorhabditis briggsae]|uniref:Protein CBG17900 n=1 Tax=Caenorhabditis briggsae TaxID=6238 RepID=A8XS23_CAEBR|nr:Protein CBG17900 [Caenorhabditis briggsae]CAP35442.1 Protein CBG17900 [Caenorhabditis briggsae]
MVHRGLKTPVAQSPAWQDSTLVPLFSYYSLLEYSLLETWESGGHRISRSKSSERSGRDLMRTITFDASERGQESYKTAVVARQISVAPELASQLRTIWIVQSVILIFMVSNNEEELNFLLQSKVNRRGRFSRPEPRTNERFRSFMLDHQGVRSQRRDVNDITRRIQ